MLSKGDLVEIVGGMPEQPARGKGKILNTLGDTNVYRVWSFEREFSVYRRERDLKPLDNKHKLEKHYVINR